MKNPRDIIPKKEYYKAGEIKETKSKYVEAKGIIGMTLYQYEHGINKSSIWVVLIAFYVGFAWATTWAIIWHDIGCLIGYIIGGTIIIVLSFRMPYKFYHMIDENEILIK